MSRIRTLDFGLNLSAEDPARLVQNLERKNPGKICTLDFGPFDEQVEMNTSANKGQNVIVGRQVVQYVNK